jgi:hypothetical protein
VRKGALTLIALLVAGQGWAADTVLVGTGLTNSYVSAGDCSPGAICLDAVYVWELEAKRVVAGPAVEGRIRALSAQHVGATPKYVRSVEVFVLRPVDNAQQRRDYGVTHALVALSPRYRGSRYCLSINPSEIGLKVPKEKISVEPGSGNYCFSRDLLR